MSGPDDDRITATLAEDGVLQTAEPPPRPAPHKPRRVALIVTLAVLGVLAACALGYLALRAGLRAIEVSPESQSAQRTSAIETAAGFLEARYSGQYMAIKEYMTPEAQGAISDDDWNIIDAKAPVLKAELLTFSAPNWSGKTSGTIEYSRKADVSEPGAPERGTLSLQVDPNEPTRVNVTQSSNGQVDTETVMVQRAMDGTWYVVGGEYQGATQTYDAAFIRAMLADAKTR